MRVLLTGGNGMVGRNILEHTLAQKHEMVAPGRGELDLLDAEAVRRFMARVKPDAIIHSAGVVDGIAANVAEPVRFLTENLQIGTNLILGAHGAGVRMLLNLASSCMYPRNCDGYLTEDMVLSGELEPTNEGYALAKIVATRLCQYLRQNDPGLLYKTLIPCNLYGRWDHYDSPRSHMVAAIIRKLSLALNNNEKSVTIWGTGNARREFMYVADLAECVFWALDRIDTLPDLLNAGTGIDYTVTEYYEKAAKLMGYTGSFEYDLTKPEGMKRKVMNVSKINALGWRATTSVEEGLRKSYEFYRDEFRGGDKWYSVSAG